MATFYKHSNRTLFESALVGERFFPNFNSYKQDVSYDVKGEIMAVREF